MSPLWRASAGSVGQLKNGLPHHQSLKQYNAFISFPDSDLYAEAANFDFESSFFTNIIAVKDNIATARYPTTCGSKILQHYRSPFEATVVASVRDGRRSGTKRQVLGKTNMDEFGMGSHSTHSFFGPVEGGNPWREYSVGGSSGGSASAVATGQVRSALGTDTGGSVRLPAAYTGIAGFKPSYGLLSRWGVVPYANSLDTVGILGSHTPAILSHFHSEMQRPDDRDPTSLSKESLDRMKERRRSLAIASGRPDHKDSKNTRKHMVPFYLQNNFAQLKIGIPVEYNIEELDPEVRLAWKMALKIFQSQGCTLVPISLPNTKHALSAYYVIAAAEAASNLSKYDGVRYGTRAKSKDGAGDVLYSRTRGEGFGDEVKRRILLGSYSLSSEAVNNYFVKAQKVRRLVQRDFDRVFSLPNLLRPEEQFDLSDMDESVSLENKLGPPQVDFIVCPTAPTLPPTRESVSKQSPVDTYMNDIFTVPSSLAGLPAITLPFKTPSSKESKTRNSSVGIQIIGQFSDDNRLLLTATAVEQLQKVVYKFLYDDGHRGRFRKLPYYPATTEDAVSKDEPASPTIIRYTSAGSVIRNVVPSSKPETIIRKHLSSKGDGHDRQPHTDQEIQQSIETAFQDWDDMFSGKQQPLTV